jgi:hypothetical protein
MSEKKRKILYIVFKGLSIIISCALPIYAVWEHFPIWTMKHGAGHSVGTGGIICLVVLAIVFRKTVLNFIRDRMKLEHAPPVYIWIVMLIVAYILLYISKFIQDLTTVFWMGLAGSAIGTVLTFIAENKYGNQEKKEDG